MAVEEAEQITVCILVGTAWSKDEYWRVKLNCIHRPGVLIKCTYEFTSFQCPQLHTVTQRVTARQFRL